MIRFVGIDPSTMTGFVALDEQGAVITRKEITGIGDKDPRRIGSLVDDLIRHIHPDDVIGIEGFSYGSKGRGISFQFGLGYMIRDRIFRKKQQFTDIAPSAVKKFATGSGATKKEDMTEPIEQLWNFTHPSDNVRDAFVIAQIAKAVYEVRNGLRNLEEFPAYQQEVITTIIDPSTKKKKTERKKTKKTNKRRSKASTADSYTQNSEQGFLF